MWAKVIRVQPGKGTLKKILEQASSGDVLTLKRGLYLGTFSVPTGITIEGPSDRKAVIRGDEHRILLTAGERIVLKNLTFMGEENVTVGIEAHLHSLRIESCTFMKLHQAVVLRGSPLCDIICCHFDRIGISLRALDRSSPTVWGCCFTGGTFGIWAMNGAPYIRNCLFQDLEKGGVLFTGMALGHVEHCVFVRMKGPAVFVKDSDLDPRIQNNIFHKTRIAVGIRNGSPQITNNIVSASKEEPFQMDEGKVFTAEKTFRQNLKVSISRTGKVTIASTPEQEKGAKSPWRPIRSTHRIGFDTAGFQPYSKAALKEAPQARFVSPYVVNSIGEEYACLKMWGIVGKVQSISSTGEFPRDFQSGTKDGKEVKIEFNIHRFFGR